MAAVPALRMLPTNAVPGLEELLQIKKESGMPALKVSVSFASNGSMKDICATLGV
jgi:hypothetical protein